MTQATTGTRRSRWRDPRVWIGIGVTLAFLWLALRDVDGREVARTIAQADWLLLIGVSLPAYLLMIWVRGLRWRHLTDPIAAMPPSALARAVAVGFMANNIFPLRMGEAVRSWYLAREQGVSAAAVFGTVILERVVDTVSVVLLVCLVLLLWGGDSEGILARGALLLLPVAAGPVVFLAALKAAPDRVIRLVGALLRPVPRLAGRVEELLHKFSGGLGALRGGTHLFWLALHSAVIWLVLGPIPIGVAFVALSIDTGSWMQLAVASWLTQAAIGVAVALPSAPGFFGVFHAACRFALVRFGVQADAAVAAGTLIHAVMWVTLTALGLAVLRSRGASLGEVGRTPEGPGPPAP